MAHDDFRPSEATFRLLVDRVREYAIFFVDPSGIVRTWNAGAERIKGWRADEVIGRHFAMFYPSEAAQTKAWEAQLERALRDGRYEDFGWRVRKDGSRFWANVVVTALRDDRGAHVGYAKVTRDLTDDAFRTFVEATHAIVWTTDGDGRPIADSPTWRAFTGQTEEEWLGRRAWDPVHEADRPAMQESWARSKREKKPFEAEFRLRRANGEHAWMGVRAIPLFAADGRVREWFGVTFDISARKRAELETERARAFLATTLMSIGDGVIATDTEGRVTLMNGVAEQLTGWSSEEARGRRLLDVFAIFNEETRRRVESPVDRVLREGKIVGLANHTILVRRDGTDLPIDDSAAPIRDADGHLSGVVLVFRDKTAEKRDLVLRNFLARAGDALLTSKDYRESLITVVQLAVPRLADWCAVDIVEPGAAHTEQLAVAHVDPAKVALAREYGRRYRADPNADRGVPKVIRTGRSELYPEIPRELLEASAIDETHRRVLLELDLRSAMIVPMRGRERTFGALTFIFAESGRRYTEDDLAFAEELARRAAIIVERRKLEEERVELLRRERTAREEAEIANRAKDEFLATVSHELRTPLNAILGWTATLRKREAPPDVDRVLAIIERNARAQARLIEDVLDVSRIISGKLRLELGWSDVREAISNAAESVRPAAEAKRIALATNVDPACGAIIADRDRLQQIVWNLLSNAVKFTPAGGRVEAEALRDGSTLVLRVKDSGKGIEPSILGAIFEPFRQADASTTREHGGLGLGLAIVRQLVHAHGGTVRAESAGEGKGATFLVELPATPALPIERAIASPALASTARARAASLRDLRVLVVDDEEDSLALVRELLAASGAIVDGAASAHEAIAKLRASRPDVLVSDIGMPEIDGYALLRRVRALPASEGGRTPAVALTAYARREDADRAFAAGFQTHVPKPVEPDQLVAVVANLAGLPLGD